MGILVYFCTRMTLIPKVAMVILKTAPTLLEMRDTYVDKSLFTWRLLILIFNSNRKFQ
jgi:hypothetical protein